MSRGMAHLSATVLAQISARLVEHNVEHGALVEGRPFLNLNASDGDRVFVKVTRTGEHSRAQAAELVGSAWARRHGIAAPESLTDRVLDLVEGGKRHATVWRHLSLVPAPDLLRQSTAMVDFVARVAAVPAPGSARVLNPDDVLDRIVGRLVGRKDDTTRQIRVRAMESWMRIEDPMAGAPQTWIHGDPHARNVGWLADGSPILLDWESQARGPVEWDVAQVLRSVLAFAVDLNEAGRRRAAAQVVALVDARLDVDWALVAEVIRFRSASSASHLLVHGHDPHVLARDLALIEDDLDWLRPRALAA